MGYVYSLSQEVQPLYKGSAFLHFIISLPCALGFSSDLASWLGGRRVVSSGCSLYIFTDRIRAVRWEEFWKIQVNCFSGCGGSVQKRFKRRGLRRAGPDSWGQKEVTRTRTDMVNCVRSSSHVATWRSQAVCLGRKVAPVMLTVTVTEGPGLSQAGWWPQGPLPGPPPSRQECGPSFRPPPGSGRP